MKKILIVEDFNEMRNNLVDVLEHYGFETYSAENGLIGFELAKKTLPSLIISDIMMPVMGGIKLLYKIRKIPITKSIPLIFISARSTEFDVDFGLRVGADAYVTKPFSIKKLLNVVNDVINKHSKP